MKFSILADINGDTLLKEYEDQNLVVIFKKILLIMTTFRFGILPPFYTMCYHCQIIYLMIAFSMKQPVIDLD